MTDSDILKVVQEELNNIAPEADLASLDPAADLREAIDIELDGFPDLHHRYSPSARAQYPRDRLSEAYYA